MAPSPLEATSFEAMESKFGMIMVSDEDFNVTVHNRPMSAQIPDRITCAVGLELRESTTGKRVFVKEDVKEGDLIFSSKPLLNIIDDDDVLKYTCDNCMVTRVNGMSSRHRSTSTTLAELVEDAEIKFLACGSCKTLYYCSKKCQREAWKDHHKIECETFAKIREGPEGARVLLNKRKTRFVIRLLELRANDKLSEADWNEVLALATNRDSKMAMTTFGRVARAVSQLVKAFVDTDVSEDEIVDLFCMVLLPSPISTLTLSHRTQMRNNQCGISVPLIKGCRMHDPKIPTECMIGTCLEPFLSNLAHACIPSARTVHENAELRVRATRDLTAGSELTTCYAPDTRDYQTRKKDLQTFWLIDCTCTLCQKGDFGPQGPLHDQIQALLLLDSAKSPNHIEHIRAGIQAMLDAGFTYSSNPMHELHKQLLRSYLAQMNTAESLKLALKIRYQIEPLQYPHTSLSSRIATLYILQSLLNFPAPETSNLNDLPMSVKKLAMQVNFHLRDMLARDVEQCYGSDSMVASFEKGFAERQATEWNVKVWGSRKKLYRYVPLHESEAERSKFVKNMNALLGWAGLDALEAKDLL